MNLNTLYSFFMLDSYYSPYDFQTPATPIAEGIIRFHHDLMILLTFICFFVLWVLMRTAQLHIYPDKKDLVLTRGAYSFTYFKHQGMLLEIVWALAPAFILMFIAIPSFALLYSTSTFCSPELILISVRYSVVYTIMLLFVYYIINNLLHLIWQLY